METFQRPLVIDMIVVLEEVKIRITNFSVKYICLGLEAVGQDFRKNQTAYYLEEYIHKALGYNYDGAVLERWINDYRPELCKRHTSIMQYRIQWIDWMLDGLKEELKNENAQGQTILSNQD